MPLALFISLAVAMNFDSGGTSATKKYQSSISASGAVSVVVSNLDQEEDERSISGSETAVLGEEEAPPAKLTQSAARGSSKPMFYLTLS